MSKQEQIKVGEFIEHYLKTRKEICLIIFLVDIRHDPTSNDFLMYLGIDRDDLTTYMRRDGIVFDATNYTNEIQLRKIDLKQFISFCIKNQKNMIKVDNQEEIVVL